MKLYISLFFILTSLGCQKHGETQEAYITTSSGLQYTILKEGLGESARVGQDVKIHESTSYRDGTLIFTSENIEPLQFTLGGTMVIKGVDEGVQGMKKGEIRKLIVPTSLSQRSSYPPILSKDSILVYKIELIDIIN